MQAIFFPLNQYNNKLMQQKKVATTENIVDTTNTKKVDKKMVATL